MASVGKPLCTPNDAGYAEQSSASFEGAHATNSLEFGGSAENVAYTPMVSTCKARGDFTVIFAPSTIPPAWAAAPCPQIPYARRSLTKIRVQHVFNVIFSTLSQ